MENRFLNCAGSWEAGFEMRSLLMRFSCAFQKIAGSKGECEGVTATARVGGAGQLDGPPAANPDGGHPGAPPARPHPCGCLPIRRRCAADLPPCGTPR